MSNLTDKFPLVVLGAAIFISMLGVGIIVPFLPIYARQLGATGLTLGLIFSAFSAARAISLPLVGSLSDRRGRKPLILLGLAGYTMVALLFLTADSAWDLIALRGLQGIFAAMVLPVSMALVADLAPQGREGRIFGYFNTSLLLGLGMGPLMGGMVYDFLGVNANFIFMAALSLLGLLVVFGFVKEPTDTPRGAETQSAWKSQLTLLRDRNIWGICLARAGNSAAMGCLLAFLPVLSELRGVSSSQVGLLLGVNMFVTTGFQPLAGWLADRWRRDLLAGGGQLLMAISKVLLPMAGGLHGIMILVILDGMAAGLAIPPLTALAVSHGRRLGSGMGVVMGLFTMAMSVGFFLGPIVGGLTFDIWGIEAVFRFAAVMAAIGALAVLVFTRPE